MEQKKEKKYTVVNILCGLLTAFGIAVFVISLISGSNTYWLSTDCINCLLLLMVSIYAFVGYKKPHGNVLKYILLICSARYLLAISVLIQYGIVWRIILDAVQIGLICYTAGRLHKVKENIILMVALTACILTAVISDAVSGIASIGMASPLIIWLDICVAYFLRYKQHREAGLEDAPKGK